MVTYSAKRAELESAMSPNLEVGGTSQRTTAVHVARETTINLSRIRRMIQTNLDDLRVSLLKVKRVI